MIRDYWVAFDSINFTVPGLIQFLSWFTGGGYNNPVPVGLYGVYIN